MSYPCPSSAHSEDRFFDLVAVVGSFGGLRALREIGRALPADFPAPIIAVQHLGASAPEFIAGWVGRALPIPVHWAQDGEAPDRGRILLAPPDRHLRIDGRRRVRLDEGPRVHYTRPAGDPLFHSVASEYGSRAIAVVLSGRLTDGATGALAIRRAGGVVIAQEPASCVAASMPAAAIRLGAPQFVLPPSAIAAALVSLVTVPGTAALFGVTHAA